MRYAQALSQGLLDDSPAPPKSKPSTSSSGPETYPPPKYLRKESAQQQQSPMAYQPTSYGTSMPSYAVDEFYGSYVSPVIPLHPHS